VSAVYLFDIDGTLVLTGGAAVGALDRAFETRFGVAGALAQVSCAGKTDPIIVEEAFAAALGRAPTAAEVDEIIELYLPLLRTALLDAPRFRVMPAVREALDYLAAHGDVVLGLATGNVRPAARLKLEHADLWRRFAFGGFGCDHRDRARLVARAIERAGEQRGRGVDPREVVVVGDTPLDVAAARACGARAVAVATGSASLAELAACAPDAALATLAELPAWHAAHAA